jgi:hypothetical protein
VPIVPVAIQTPVERGNPGAVAVVAMEVELGATTAGRLGLGCTLGVGLGRPIASAPPSATVVTIAAAASMVLDNER